jgi:hypothetical protein
METIRIGVFFTNHKQWKLLPNISEFLTENKLIPNLGDRITAINTDHNVMEITADSLENCVTVKEKIFHYNNYHIALVCEYVPF